MKVSFCLTRADHAAYSAAYSRAIVDVYLGYRLKSALWQWSERIILCLFLLLSVSIALNEKTTSSYCSALFWCVLLIAPPLLGRRNWQKWLRQHEFDPCMDIELKEEGVYSRNSLGAATIAWKDIGVIKDDRKYILLSRWNYTGLLVPKRAFNSPAEIEGFVRLATTYWQQTHGIQPVAPPPPIAAP